LFKTTRTARSEAQSLQSMQRQHPLPHGFRDFARNDMERRLNNEVFEVEIE